MRRRSPEMPSDTRYARAATARRSPNARLYSAVPRSSQCPSIVIAHAPYFFSVAAFVSSAVLPSSVISLLSYSKNTGFSGELRFRSSSELDAMASSRSGSGGTSVGSRTGSGGPGTREAEAGGAEDGGGGGGILATGGFLAPQAAAVISTMTRAPRAAVEDSLIPALLRSFGPIGLVVIADVGDLFHILAVTRNNEHLCLA